MATDDPEGLHRPADEPRRFLGGIAVTDAVKPVLADALCLAQFDRQAVQIGFSRHRSMQSRVKDGHIRNAGQLRLASLDAQDTRMIMQRRQLRHILIPWKPFWPWHGSAGLSHHAVDNDSLNRPASPKCSLRH
jgi:hypothetical protein